MPALGAPSAETQSGEHHSTNTHLGQCSGQPVCCLQPCSQLHCCWSPGQCSCCTRLPHMSADSSQQLPSVCGGVCCALLHETNTPFESKTQVSASVPNTRHDTQISQTLRGGATRILHVKNEGLQNLTEASALKMWVGHEDRSYPLRADVGEIFSSLQCIKAFGS